jgi:hypothetical protein
MNQAWVIIFLAWLIWNTHWSRKLMTSKILLICEVNLTPWSPHKKSCLHLYCHNPNLGFTTKAKACKGAGEEWVRESHFMLSGVQESVREWTPSTLKWTPTLVVGIPMDFRIFKRWLQGLKLIGLKNSLHY